MPFRLLTKLLARTGLFRLLFWLTLAAITVLSLLPLQGPPPVPGGDKTHHLIAYWVLAFLAVLAFFASFWQRSAGSGRWLATIRLGLLGLGLVAYSGLIEVVQGYVGRYPEWLDLAFNAGGTVAGLLMALGLLRLHERKLRA